MKIWIICSKTFYKDVKGIKEKLEKLGHEIILPNSCDNPEAEIQSWNLSQKEHNEFKKRMFKLSEEKVEKADAVLTLNFDKNGQKNYIGGATFLELYLAFRKDKKIFLYNPVPKGILYDEISGFNPTIINGNLDLIK